MKLDEAKSIVMTVVLLIILAAIGVLVLKELMTDLKTSGTATNLAYTGAGTPNDLIETGNYDFPADIGGMACGNSSGANETLNSGNWTLDSTYGTINFTVGTVSGDIGVEAVNNVFSCNYTFTTGNLKTDTITNATLGISNLTKQVPTFGIIIGILLIIGAVFLMALYFGKRSGYA